MTDAPSRTLDEISLIGYKSNGLPLLVDFAAAESARMTPDPEIGFSSNPQMEPGEDGSLWTCRSLGPGVLVAMSPLDTTPLPDTREHLRRLAASL